MLGVGWFIVGGTSVAAPSLAGIINAGDAGAWKQAKNQGEHANVFNGPDFRDISYGNCGLNIGSFAVPGYDLTPA